MKPREFDQLLGASGACFEAREYISLRVRRQKKTVKHVVEQMISEAKEFARENDLLGVIESLPYSYYDDPDGAQRLDWVVWPGDNASSETLRDLTYGQSFRGLNFNKIVKYLNDIVDREGV